MTTSCNHNYEKAIKKGRCYYVCPKCGGDITMQIYLVSLLEKKKDNEKYGIIKE